MKKTIRLGIYGARRGGDLGRAALLANADVVAICDSAKDKLEERKTQFPDATLYTEFDKFIEHDMDGVILANFFHEHAPYAIRLLERGIHVLSECTSNSTMAEGVALVRAAEKSEAIYMLSENYPYMKFNLEMKRICDGGTLGKILYAEGEYNHPGNGKNIRNKKYLNYFPEHWRNFLPRTYYVTHSLAPIMSATGAIPRRVTAFSCTSDEPIDNSIATASHISPDVAAIIMTKNDDGSVFKFTAHSSFGAHANSYRIAGKRGQIENLRGMGEKVMLRYNSWQIPEGREEINLYEPSWHDEDSELIEKTGHGGGDYLVVREFIRSITDGRKPDFDVYFATTMASVGILAHRSVLDGGKPYDIPDFRLEDDRRKWENDDLSPFWYSDGRAPTIPCCSINDYKPSDEQMRLFREIVMEEKEKNK